MRYTVWQRGLATSHTAPFFSTATAFHILLSAVHTPFLIPTYLFLSVSDYCPQVVIIAPLLVAYRSQGFWMRSASYQEQAEVRIVSPHTTPHHTTHTTTHHTTPHHTTYQEQAEVRTNLEQ